MFDDIMYQSVLSNIKLDTFENKRFEWNNSIKKKINIWFSLYKMFNQNDIAGATRIFLTTGYSDGLSRIGDYYANKNEKLKALKFYHLAHNTYKEGILLDKLAEIIRILI